VYHNYKKTIYMKRKKFKKTLVYKFYYKFKKYLDLMNQRKYDAAIDYQCDFQDPANIIMEGIIDLHHDLIFLLIFII